MHHHSSVALAAAQAAAQSSCAAAAAATAGAKALQAAPQAPLQPGRQPRGALGQGVRDGRQRAEGRRGRGDIVMARPAGCIACQSCLSRHVACKLSAGKVFFAFRPRRAQSRPVRPPGPHRRPRRLQHRRHGTQQAARSMFEFVATVTVGRRISHCTNWDGLGNCKMHLRHRALDGV